jgi:prepilin-type N-terminal cleavage/methylation domain-containing protein
MLLETEMTISERLRRDPQKGKKEFSTHHGFSVIELMIAVAVLAIITSLALPSYRALIEKRQVTSGAQQISAFLSSAKMEAIKRNEMIAVWRDEANQCLGYYSFNPDNPRGNCDCTVLDPNGVNACAIDEFDDGANMGLRVMSNSILNKPVDITAIDLGGDDDLVIFDPIRGMLVEGDTVANPLEVKMVSDDETYALNVRLSATGRVTICSDLSGPAIAVPGFDECQVLQ